MKLTTQLNPTTATIFVDAERLNVHGVAAASELVHEERVNESSPGTNLPLLQEPRHIRVIVVSDVLFLGLVGAARRQNNNKICAY